MFERLIESLTLNYTYMAQGREFMSKYERDAIVHVGAVMIKHAPKVLVPDYIELTKEAKTDLKECELIQDHVQQMAEWIEQLRITEIM